MTPLEPELEHLLGPLREGPVALSGSAEQDAQRARLLPALRAEVERVPARLQRARFVRRASAGVAGASVLAAAAAMLLLLQRHAESAQRVAEPLRIEPGSASVTWIDSAGAPRAIGRAITLDTAGDLIGARDSWSHVSTARGVQLDLSPRALLRVNAVAQISDSAQPLHDSGLRLMHGEVHCRVPKLGKDKQFSITTPDAQVIVHGTVFSVAVSDSSSPTTCVRVDEGLVEVRHGGERVFLGPSKQWGCETSAPAPSASARPADEGAIGDTAPALRGGAIGDTAPALRGGASFEQPRAVTRTERAQTQPRHPGRANRALDRTPEGTLDEENRILAAGLAAERDGDLARARAFFAQLLAKHPKSPLVPEARLGLARAR